MKKGKLFLIPTLLGDTAPMEVLPISVRKVIENTSVYIVENEKNARRFIKRITPNKIQDSLKILILNKYTDPFELNTFLDPCLQGENIGLMSDAGCPGIADPGQLIVAMAHQKGIQITPFVGPTSIILTLMASGLNGQKFAFQGYLPIEPKERINAIKKFEKISREQQQTQLFIETPYRNEKLFSEFLKHLSIDTSLCLGIGITTEEETIKTMSVKEWRNKNPKFIKIPTVFAFMAKG